MHDKMSSTTRDDQISLLRMLSEVSIKRSWVFVTFLIAVAIVFSWHFIDRPLAEFFYTHDTMPIYAVPGVLTELGEGSFYIIGSLLLYLFWRKAKPVMARAALFVFTTTILAGIITNIIKVIFGRARPGLYEREEVFGFFWIEFDVALRSFPSGHTTTAIGTSLALALLFPRYRWLLISLGVIIASTRVILTNHYLSDVLAGGYVGAMTTLILYVLFYPHDQRSR